MENETFVCDRCNLTLPVTRRVVFDGEELCESCYDELTADCERCGERIWLDDNAGNSQTVLCEDCYEDHYTRCSHCGTLLPRSEAYMKRMTMEMRYPIALTAMGATRTIGQSTAMDTSRNQSLMGTDCAILASNWK